LLILPAWLDCPAEHSERLLIRMDPGSAFGTGSHPTTRLCLEALEQLAAERGGSLAGLQVADLGCGSGVLGLASLRLGASAVVAADTDSLAVTATTANVALNGLETHLTVRLGSAEVLADLLPQGPADLLLCNILAPVIEALSPAFDQLLAASGVGLLSGLLVDQAPRLQQVLADQGWQADLVARMEPWGLLLLHKSR
jgi:ribosomal protein L11 methyltransferase